MMTTSMTSTIQIRARSCGCLVLLLLLQTLSARSTAIPLPASFAVQHTLAGRWPSVDLVDGLHACALSAVDSALSLLAAASAAAAVGRAQELPSPLGTPPWGIRRGSTTAPAAALLTSYIPVSMASGLAKYSARRTHRPHRRKVEKQTSTSASSDANVASASPAHAPAADVALVCLDCGDRGSCTGHDAMRAYARASSMHARLLLLPAPLLRLWPAAPPPSESSSPLQTLLPPTPPPL